MNRPVLSLDDVLDLKEYVKERFGEDVHFHDACGGQSFEVANMTPELKAYLTGYFDGKNLHAVFSDTDGIFSLTG